MAHPRCAARGVSYSRREHVDRQQRRRHDAQRQSRRDSPRRSIGICRDADAGARETAVKQFLVTGCRFQGRRRRQRRHALHWCCCSRSHGKPLFLQMKEASKSVVAQILRGRESIEARATSHDGQRVVHGQRLMQAATDPFLGWVDGAVRPRAVHAPVARHEDIGGTRNLRRATRFANMPRSAAGCSHARMRRLAAARWKSPGYMGNGERMAEALVRYGRAYADQVEKDYEVSARRVAMAGWKRARMRTWPRTSRPEAPRAA